MRSWQPSSLSSASASRVNGHPLPALGDVPLAFQCPHGPAQCSVEMSLLGHGSPRPPEMSTGEKAISPGAESPQPASFWCHWGARGQSEGPNSHSPDRPSRELPSSPQT